MIPLRRIGTIAALGLVVVACLPACTSADASSPATTTERAATTDSPKSGPSTTDPATVSPSGGSAIAEVDFRNFTFDFPEAADGASGPAAVTVVDGEYSAGTPPESFYFEVLDVDLADLDGDNVQEAAVTVHYSTGGTGQFTDVLVYRWAGSAAELVTSAGVGDRGDGGVDDVSVAPAGGVVGEVLVIRRNADAEGACCPTATEERTFQLRDAELVEIGDPEKWGIVRVGVDEDGAPSTDPTEVRFLPGTNRADLTGDATEPVSATFEASAGQHLAFELDVDAAGDAPLLVVLSGPSGEIGRSASGHPPTIEATLPDSGRYRLEFSPDDEVDPNIGVFFDAQLRVE